MENYRRSFLLCCAIAAGCAPSPAAPPTPRLGPPRDPAPVCAAVAVVAEWSERDSELAGALQHALVRRGRVPVVESALVDSMLDEFRFQSTGLVRDDHAVALGEMQAPDRIIVASDVIAEAEVVLAARVIDPSSGRMVAAARRRGPPAARASLEEELAEQLEEALCTSK